MDFDLIVVGSGGAGLAATRTASEMGKRVLLLEAAAQLGGSTALAGGVFYAAGTSVQRAAGISDGPDAMYRYYMAVNGCRLDGSVIRKVCTEGAPTFEWLISLGVRFPLEHLFVAGLDGVRRGHRAAGLGREIVDVLEGSLSGLEGVDISRNSRVDGLVMSKEGAVAGVTIGGEKVTASAVVIATGGFGNNREMLSQYFPSVAIYGDWIWYIGAPTCRGDGLAMGLRAGGTLTGFDTGGAILTAGFSKDFEPYLPGWFVFVSRDGRRFADETIDYSVSSTLVRKLPGGECFAIFDEAARQSARLTTSKTKDQTNAYPHVTWTGDRLAAMADAGKIFRADTLEELADRAGINAPRLNNSIDIYNRDCDAAVDSAYGKQPSLLLPVRSGPFYAVCIRPAISGATGAGLRIDSSARVLDSADRPIKGLYAAGEAVGSTHGECYVGSGGMIANATTLGRIAARHVATCVPD